MIQLVVSKGVNMKIGYARTSTLEQEAGLRAQIRDLELEGCEKIFQEQVSSVATRPELDQALDFVREGDCLIVTKLDRLASSVTHLGEIVKIIQDKQADLKILNLGIDTSTATGKLILNVMGSISEFEREMMLERQREGIAKAKAEGKYKGRSPTARAKSDEVIKLANQNIGATEISRQVGISRASVYRILGN